MSAKTQREKDLQRVLITISLGNDGEAKRAYVSNDSYGDMLIERGKEVDVPRWVLEILDNAIVGVSETDPDDETKTVVVDRKRYPYTVHGIAA